jgi:hypothetical protein
VRWLCTQLPWGLRQKGNMKYGSSENHISRFDSSSQIFCISFILKEYCFFLLPPFLPIFILLYYISSLINLTIIFTIRKKVLLQSSCYL